MGNQEANFINFLFLRGRNLFKNIFIYLFAVSSLSCIMHDLLLGHTESLVVMLGLSRCGAQALEQVGGLRSCGAWA